MEKSFLIISKLLPVFLMITLGYVLKKLKFFSERIVDSLKKLVVNIGLPSLLFTAFSTVSFKSKYFLLFIMMFSVCVLLLLIGNILRKHLRMSSPYFPMLMTGFEAGMVGYSVYTVAFGVEKLYEFALIDFGHVTFIFSIFVGLMMRLEQRGKRTNFLLSFITSPPIIGVLGGLVLGSFGIFRNIENNYVLSSIHQTLKYLGSLVVPLICLIIGYDIELSGRNVKDAFKTIIVRLGVSIPIALIAGEFLVMRLFGFDAGFKRAVITMMVLPPPFIMPLFIREENQREMQYVLNTLSLHTLISLIVLVVIFSIL